MTNPVDISVILPCHNEEDALAFCIDEIRQTLKNRSFEIIVSDSSTDRSPVIARERNVRIIKHDTLGYGNAYLKAFPEARGEYVVIADADYSYDFSEIPKLLAELEKGADLVIGSRLQGDIQNDAMPFLHRYFGNPFLSFLFRFLFKTQLSDTQSGFRAIKKRALEKLPLQTPGMEFASEMLLQAIKKNLAITEVPITYRKRLGQSKLKSFNDGWKHLRFMLLYSPAYLFLLPGILLFIAGVGITLIFLFPPVRIFNFTFITHPMFFGSATAILGYQLLLLGVFAKTYAHNTLQEKSPFVDWLNSILNLERALVIGFLTTLLGIGVLAYLVIDWIQRGFGLIENPNLSIFALTLTIIGIQTIFSAFFISILGIKTDS